MTETLDADIRLAEALIFASAAPVLPSAILRVLSDFADLDAVMAALAARYQGGGVELVHTTGGWQFRTAPDLAPLLRQVIETPRRLSRVAMETLAIVAYHQPVTRPEIEDIRGATLSQATLDQLLDYGLVEPCGRKEAPGRPTLWGTTRQFLTHFGLANLQQLPRRDDLLLDPQSTLLALREN
ncbi:MAG: SMC-Scp complex subunit ScpB [Acetobacteraceae bacterium]|nr:SMC-Scp complex subunit ScpB [Acetobacteraceae bacterium]